LLSKLREHVNEVRRRILVPVPTELTEDTPIGAEVEGVVTVCVVHDETAISLPGSGSRSATTRRLTTNLNVAAPV